MHIGRFCCHSIRSSLIVLFATLFPGLKRPPITQKHDEPPDAAVGADGGPGAGAADGPGGRGLSLDEPRLQLDKVEGQAEAIAGGIRQADKPIVFEEDNKAGIKADELGEEQKQVQGAVLMSTEDLGL